MPFFITEFAIKLSECAECDYISCGFDSKRHGKRVEIPNMSNKMQNRHLWNEFKYNGYLRIVGIIDTLLHL